MAIDKSLKDELVDWLHANQNPPMQGIVSAVMKWFLSCPKPVQDFILGRTLNEEVFVEMLAAAGHMDIEEYAQGLINARLPPDERPMRIAARKPPRRDN